MQKLTYLEAQAVMQEAYRLKELYRDLYRDSKVRLGQVIWWCAYYGEISNLSEELEEKLYDIINTDRGTDDDFYYWDDEVTVTNKFYERYVEQY